MEVTGPTIELRTLTERHPRWGDTLLHQFAAPVILRLGHDPRTMAPGDKQRLVMVERRSWHDSPRTELRMVGWQRMPKYEKRARELSNVLDESTLTEHAAIGVMLLLIHELEGGILEDVLAPGSGGDYLMRLPSLAESIRVEVSGLRLGFPGDATHRFKQKSNQLLRPGCVSVTTFGWMNEGWAHSYLHLLSAVPEAGRLAKTDEPPATKRE